jgi:hypothetical protein
MNRRDRRRAAALRRLPVAPDSIECVMEVDRRFFAQHPERRFYMRPMHPAERKATTTSRPVGVEMMMVIVEQVAPGTRVRTCVGVVGDIDPATIGDAKCRELFFASASQQVLDLRAALLLNSGARHGS